MEYLFHAILRFMKKITEENREVYFTQYQLTVVIKHFHLVWVETLRTSKVIPCFRR